MKLLIKRLLKKRNNGGFTLVEVVISCALLAILVLGVTGFAGPVLNMLKDEKKDARATQLADTLNSYISGVLKDAKFVAVYENATFDDAKDTASALKSIAGTGDKGLNKMATFMSTPENQKKYQVCCLGIRWYDDDKTGRKKLMLTNEQVTSNYGLKEGGSSPVFTNELYDGLCPVIKFETFGPLIDDGTGNMIRDTTKANASGYKLTTQIYSDENCYAVNSVTRNNKARLSFTAVTFFECSAMKNSDSSENKPAEEPNKLGELQNQIDAKQGSLGCENGYNERAYYPDTYIFYVVAR